MPKNKIDFDTYVKWSAHLVSAGHNYICVSGKALICAASIDAEAGECPGYFFRQITRMIGGAPAEPASHIRVAIEFLRHAWNDPSALRYREKTTGFLLEQLIRERTADYGRILRTIVRAAAGVTVVNPVNRCPTVVVPAGEVERFARKYISLFALARQQGRHHMAVKKELDAGGIEPALDPGKIGATFYRKADLTGK